MEKISEQIAKLVEDSERNFENDTSYEELREASEYFDEMVKQGIVKKRGYNLLSIDQNNIIQPSFNFQR